jgi:hypothetical protein
MPEKRNVTAFTLVDGRFFSTVLYGSEPIPSDYRWGAYRRVIRDGIVFHFFQRGGLLSDEAVTDIIEAHRNGRTRKTGDMIG